jgi:uncharacterized membrane protein (UPF0127 family)
MKMVEVRNTTRDAKLAGRVMLADGWWTRLRGMLGRPEPTAEEGMLLAPCQSVHMYWMRYPLDVAFLASDGRVVATYHGLAPSGRSKWHRDAERALELKAGRLAATQTEVGDRLELRQVGERSDHG